MTEENLIIRKRKRPGALRIAVDPWLSDYLSTSDLSTTVVSSSPPPLSSIGNSSCIFHNNPSTRKYIQASLEAHISTQQGAVLVPDTPSPGPNPQAPSSKTPDIQPQPPPSDGLTDSPLTVHEFLERSYTSKRRRIVNLQEHEPSQPTWTTLDVSSSSPRGRASDSSFVRSSSQFSPPASPPKTRIHTQRPPPLAKSIAQRMLQAAVSSGVQLPEPPPGDRRPLPFGVCNRFSSPPKRRPTSRPHKVNKRLHTVASMKVGPGLGAEGDSYHPMSKWDPNAAHSEGRRGTKMARTTHKSHRQPTTGPSYPPLMFVSLEDHEQARRSKSGFPAPVVKDITHRRNSLLEAIPDSAHTPPDAKGRRTPQRHLASRRRASFLCRPRSKRHTLDLSFEDADQPESRPLRSLASLLEGFMETARVAAQTRENGTGD